MKRRAGSERFASTVSIGSSVFRSWLLERAASDLDVAAELRGPVREQTAALDRLAVRSDGSKLRSVPTPAVLEPLAGRLGDWVSPERWDTEGSPGSTAPHRQVRTSQSSYWMKNTAILLANTAVCIPSRTIASNRDGDERSVERQRE